MPLARADAQVELDHSQGWLSEASRKAGCMSARPGSHHQTRSHDETYNTDNLLTRGQRIAGIDPLRPGQASFHNVATAHRSGPNRSDDRRIGLSLHYMPTHTRSGEAMRRIVYDGADTSQTTL